MATGYDLQDSAEASAALGAAVKEALAGERPRVVLEEQQRRADVACRGARHLAFLVGATEPELKQEGAAALAQELLSQDEAGAAATPTDFKAKDSALASFSRAVRVRESLAHAVTKMVEARSAALQRLWELRAFLVGAELLTDVEADRVVKSALDTAKLPADCLSGEPPVEKQSIVDLVVRVLKLERRAMSTAALIDALAKLGRVIDARNPSATIRSAIVARTDAPVVSVGRGLWWLAGVDGPPPSQKEVKAGSSRRGRGGSR